MRISIVIPAYNEEQVIAASLKSLLIAFDAHFQQVELIVVDDGSSDGTSSAAIALGLHNVHVLRHDRRLGKGAALRTGLSAASCAAAGWTDADLPIAAVDLARLAMECVDLGSFVSGVRDRSSSDGCQAAKSRRAASALVRALVRMKSRPTGFQDPWCPAKFGQTDALHALAQAVVFDGFLFDADLLRRATIDCNLTVIERSVPWRDVRGPIQWNLVLSTARELSHFLVSASGRSAQQTNGRRGGWSLV